MYFVFDTIQCITECANSILSVYFSQPSVSSLMYAQVCTRLDIAFVVGVLGRYLSDPSQSHWKVDKKVLKYLQGTKDFMLTYRHTDTLKVVSFSDSDYADCVDDKQSTYGYIFMMAEEVVSWKNVK